MTARLSTRIRVTAARAGLIALSWAVSVGFAIAEPKAGQTLPEFQDAVYASLAAQGDKMGYAFEPCELKPAFTAAGKTFVGRTFSGRNDTGIVLVAVEQDKVARWQEFSLPDLQGWLTHGWIRCKGPALRVVHGRVVQQYRWSGRDFMQRK